MKDIAQHEMAKFIGEAMKAIEANTSETLDQTTFDQTVQNLNHELSESPFAKFLDPERDIQLGYIGLLFDEHVQSIEQQVIVSVAGCYKGLAVECGAVEAFWIEGVLPFREAPGRIPKVAPQLVRGVQASPPVLERVRAGIHDARRSRTEGRCQ